MIDIVKPARARKTSAPRPLHSRTRPAPSKKPVPAKKPIPAANKPARKSCNLDASPSLGIGTETGADTHDTRAPDGAPTHTPAIMRRVQLAIARELARIEAIIDDPSAPLAHGDAERTARTLATLARTLKEITQLGVLKKKAKAKKASSGKSKSPHDQSMPRDLDEFRRELARRLDALVAGSAPASSERNDGG